MMRKYGVGLAAIREKNGIISSEKKLQASAKAAKMEEVKAELVRLRVEEGLSPRRSAAILGFSRTMARNALNANPEAKLVKVVPPDRFYTEDELNEIKRLRSDGMSFGKIAAHFGTNDRKAMAHRWRRAMGGLPMPGGKGKYYLP